VHGDVILVSNAPWLNKTSFKLDDRWRRSYLSTDGYATRWRHHYEFIASWDV